MTQSPKFLAFVAALEKLCKEHGVRLTVGRSEGLDVWDAQDGREPIPCAGIEDRTGPSTRIPEEEPIDPDGQDSLDLAVPRFHEAKRVGE